MSYFFKIAQQWFSKRSLRAKSAGGRATTTGNTSAVADYFEREWEKKGWSVFTHVTSIYANLLDYIRKEINSHRTGLEHQHGRRLIVFNTNMAAVTSCENVLFPPIAFKLSFFSDMKVKV